MNHKCTVRVLGRMEVHSLLRSEDVVVVVEETFRALGEGKLVHPVKEPMYVDEEKCNMLLAMPAYIKTIRVAGVKWVNLFRKQQPGLPSSLGNLLTLSHGENGTPFAILEASDITTMRTAGGHAVVAAKYLARRDASVLSVIGCGEEAIAGVRSFLKTFALNKLCVFDVKDEAMERMSALFGERVEVVCCSDAKHAAEQADILLMTTTARKPLVSYEWLRPGCFVAGMYAFHDLDRALAHKADKWVLGSRETDYHQIICDPGLKDCELTMELVHADMGEIVTGKRPGRESDDEIIVYTHMGMGALDVAVGKLVYDRAVSQKIGQMIDL